MISVDVDTHYAAHRFGIVSRAGGKVRRRQLPDTAAPAAYGAEPGQVVEFVDGDGEVIARRVSALGETHCWLRRDLAEAAMAALLAEAAEHARVIAELRDFIADTDRQGAARNGISIDQYRAKRHAAGSRWDNYRAKQRAGGY